MPKNRGGGSEVYAHRHSGNRPSEIVRHLASGEAALVLLECVLLRLLERGILTGEELADAVETAIRAKREMASDGVHTEVAMAAAGALSGLANSIALADVELRRNRPSS